MMLLIRLLLIFGLVVVDGPLLSATAQAAVSQATDGTMVVAKRRKRKRKRRRKKKKKKKRKKTAKKTKRKKVIPAAQPATSEPAKTKAKSSAAPKQAQAERPGIAMMNVDSVHGMPKGIATLVNEMILVGLKTSNRFSSVVGGSDMAAMIDLEAQKQALGCDVDSCLAELGGALGVPYMLNASLGKMGSQIVLTLKIIAVEETKVRVRNMLRAEDEGELADGIEDLVERSIDELLGPDPNAEQVEEDQEEEPQEEETPKVSDAKGGSLGGKTLLKWGGVAAGVAGAGFAVWQRTSWAETQSSFDNQNEPHTTGDFQALEEAAQATNTAMLAGLSVTGIGVALAVLGW